MRNVLASLFLLVAIACATPNFLAAFVEPLLESPPAQTNDTIAEGEGELELLKRQTGCASGYNACSGLGAPGLCCRSGSVCSADAAGHVACCPLNAACTGTIAPVGGGTTASNTGGGAATTTVPFVTAVTTTNNGVIIGTSTATTFVQQSGSQSYVRSTPLALQLIRAARRMLQAALQH